MANPTEEHEPSAGPDLTIVEMFGPTIQGEGHTVGYAAQFLRLAGCNLSCVWCDTAFSWDVSRPDPDRPPTTVTVDEVVRRLDPRADAPDRRAPAVRRLVISGGEPLLQAKALADLCLRLQHFGWVLEVETSGSVSPGLLTTIVDMFNVSPKLSHSGVAEPARLRWTVLNELARLPNATFKFVARTVQDLDEAASLLARLDHPVEASRVVVMAEGTHASQVLQRSRELVGAVVARGWGLTPRWHTLLWDDEPGR